MERESRTEASLPVQSRVNIVWLAKLVKYWESEGFWIKSMSQLISWNIDLLHEILVANGKISGEDIKVVEAKECLVKRGLMQKSLKKRGFMKLGAAVRFGGMRDVGVDPKLVDPVSYNVLHKKVKNSSRSDGRGESIEPFVGEVSVVSNEEWERAREKIEEERKKEIEKQLEGLRESKLVVNDEWVEERKRKDEEIVKRENAPVDLSMIEVVEESG